MCVEGVHLALYLPSGTQEGNVGVSGAAAVPATCWHHLLCANTPPATPSAAVVPLGVACGVTRRPPRCAASRSSWARCRSWRHSRLPCWLPTTSSSSSSSRWCPQHQQQQQLQGHAVVGGLVSSMQGLKPPLGWQRQPVAAAAPTALGQHTVALGVMAQQAPGTLLP
jgi:hypothetical protein